MDRAQLHCNPAWGITFRSLLFTGFLCLMMPAIAVLGTDFAVDNNFSSRQYCRHKLMNAPFTQDVPKFTQMPNGYRQLIV
jgi:hypothetical protein